MHSGAIKFKNPVKKNNNKNSGNGTDSQKKNFLNKLIQSKKLPAERIMYYYKQVFKPTPKSPTFNTLKNQFYRETNSKNNRNSYKIPIRNPNIIIVPPRIRMMRNGLINYAKKSGIKNNMFLFGTPVRKILNSFEKGKINYKQAKQNIYNLAGRPGTSRIPRSKKISTYNIYKRL